MTASIIIADDHPLILKGLSDFLTEKKYHLIGSAKNGRDALELIISTTPEIAILDIQMPYLTGLEIAEKCQELGLNTKIVLITVEKDQTTYLKSKELQVFGYVLKEFALNEIESCIQSVLLGKPYFSPELLSHLEIQETPEGFEDLSPTELEVLKHIARNKTAREIGDVMFVSSRTVEKHKSNIIKKIGIEAKHTTLAMFAKEIEKFLD